MAESTGSMLQNYPISPLIIQIMNFRLAAKYNFTILRGSLKLRGLVVLRRSLTPQVRSPSAWLAGFADGQEHGSINCGF